MNKFTKSLTPHCTKPKIKKLDPKKPFDLEHTRMTENHIKLMEKADNLTAENLLKARSTSEINFFLETYEQCKAEIKPDGTLPDYLYIRLKECYNQIARNQEKKCMDMIEEGFDPYDLTMSL